MKLLAALFLLPCAARAWEAHRTLDGQYIVWSFSGAQPMLVRLIDPPPTLRLKPGSDLRAALTQAALTWQAVEAAHVPVRVLEQIHARDPMPGEVVVSFDADTAFPANRDASGITDLVVSGRSITAAHVHLNARDFDWATDGSASALDVQSAVAHELGHALGLAHPCGDLATNTPSCTGLSDAALARLEADVMFPSIAPGPRRALSPDDVLGITKLQPALSPPEIVPDLLALQPQCMEGTKLGAPGLGQQVFLSVGRAPAVLERLELYDRGALLQSAPLAQRPPSGPFASTYALVSPNLAAPPATLDAVLAADSGKGGVSLGALRLAESCKAPAGCSSSGATLWGLAVLALFALRRKRVALALLLCALPAHAYKRSVNSGGLCIWWSSRGHSFMIDDSPPTYATPDVAGSGAITAIRKSFAAWATQPTCSDLSFPDQGLNVDRKNRLVGFFPGQHNVNLVLFRTASCKGGIVPAGDSCLTDGGCGNKYDCWDHGDQAIATTTTTSNRFTGQISDSDIELNNSPAPDGSRFVFTAADTALCTEANQTGCSHFDVENTVTHEAGHSLGLDHSLDPTATMFATAPEGELAKRTLHPDDIQAICDIYPAGKRTVTCVNDPITLTETGSSNGGHCASAPGQIGPGSALGALLLLLQMRRRSRRKPQLAMSASSAAASASLAESGQIS